MKRSISFREALDLTLSTIHPLDAEILPLGQLIGHVLAQELVSTVDSPSVDASLKDGYAVQSQDLADARPETPATLTVIGSVGAGEFSSRKIGPRQAIRVTTGAPLPPGGDAVLAEEFSQLSGETLICVNTAEPGRNVLRRGADIRKGDIVARARDPVTPPLVGLLATAGIECAPAFRRPLVSVLATGDEVVAPGLPLPEGKLYASNITEICAWLSAFGIPNRVVFAKDTEVAVISAIREQATEADAFISSGGIWGSERDLMLNALQTLGWDGLYHRVRIGPGKAVAFGMLEGKPFFCLPGGPPSNEMAFLQIALPGVLRMLGLVLPPFPVVTGRLTASVSGVGDWTQFIHAVVTRTDGDLSITPLQQKSRLQTMAQKNALICIPEGSEKLAAGDIVEAQLLNSQVLHVPRGTEPMNRQRD